MTCTHGGGQSCVQCRHGVDDIVEAWVLDARANVDDPLAADIAEALVRNAGGPHLDSTSPEEAATIAAAVVASRMTEGEEEEIRALRDADRLGMLPPEALIASIKHLARLLVGPAASDSARD